MNLKIIYVNKIQKNKQENRSLLLSKTLQIIQLIKNKINNISNIVRNSKYYLLHDIMGYISTQFREKNTVYILIILFFTC